MYTFRSHVALIHLDYYKIHLCNMNSALRTSLVLLFTLLCQMKADKVLPQGFVYLDEYYEQVHKKTCPNSEKIREHLRYGTEENFTGHVVRGYSNQSRAVMTVEAAKSLYVAQKSAVELGFSILLYDSYRPQKAVNCFVEWANEPDNCLKCRQNYFPYLKHKADAFELPDRYVSRQSGHSRGSTVDISLIALNQTVIHPPNVIVRQLKNGQNVNYLYDGSLDMYTSFDLFHHASWPVKQDLIPEIPYSHNRKILANIMTSSGFVPLEREWWHFTLENEPFPNQYFDFDF